VMLLAGGTFFGTSILSRVGTGAAAGLAAAGATAGAVTQVWRPSSVAAVVIRMLSGFHVLGSQIEVLLQRSLPLHDCPSLAWR